MKFCYLKLKGFAVEFHVSSSRWRGDGCYMDADTIPELQAITTAALSVLQGYV